MTSAGVLGQIGGKSGYDVATGLRLARTYTQTIDLLGRLYSGGLFGEEPDNVENVEFEKKGNEKLVDWTAPSSNTRVGFCRRQERRKIEKRRNL